MITDSREKIAIDGMIVPTIAVPLRNLKLAHPVIDEDAFNISLLVDAGKY